MKRRHAPRDTDEFYAMSLPARERWKRSAHVVSDMRRRHQRGLGGSPFSGATLSRPLRSHCTSNVARYSRRLTLRLRGRGVFRSRARKAPNSSGRIFLCSENFLARCFLFQVFPSWDNPHIGNLKSAEVPTSIPSGQERPAPPSAMSQLRQSLTVS